MNVFFIIAICSFQLFAISYLLFSVSPLDELKNFLAKFGGKWCAFSDVRKFFPLLPDEDIGPLLQTLESQATLTESGVPLDVSTGILV